MIRRTAMIILHLPQQTNTRSKSATKTLEITEDNSNENLFKKQRPDVFYKKVFLFSKIHNSCARVSFSIKLQAWALQLYLKETLAKVSFREFCEIFKNTFFAEHLRVTASDVRMQVVVIYNLNLFLQFVTINFTFSLLRVFTLAYALMSLNLSVDLLFLHYSSHLSAV